MTRLTQADGQLQSGLACSDAAAMSTPTVEAKAPRHGVPRELTTPNAAGASFERASENNIRVHRYNCVFIPENAALIITRFIAVAAAGNPKSENTLTSCVSTRARG